MTRANFASSPLKIFYFFCRSTILFFQHIYTNVVIRNNLALAIMDPNKTSVIFQQLINIRDIGSKQSLIISSIPISSPLLKKHMSLPIDCKTAPAELHPGRNKDDHCMISISSILFITASAAADTSSAKSLQIERCRHIYSTQLVISMIILNCGLRCLAAGL